MIDHITNVRQALSRVIADIPGLRVLDYTPDTWNDFPLAVVAFEHVRVGPTLAGSKLSGEITVTLMTGGANLPETLADLDPLIESVGAAVRAEPTLGGAVHYIVLDRVDGTYTRKLGSQHCPAADLHLRFMAG